MKVLITGGAGFIGANFVRFLLEHRPDWQITVLDKLTYAGRLENLKDVKNRIRFIRGDITKDWDVKNALRDVESVINFAAETHVDTSIKTPEVFVQTNVIGTFKLLEFARKSNVKNFVQISTDEVYGSTKRGKFSEDFKLDPSSPYSASKAAADMLCNSYFKTYGFDVKITRSSNNYGPFQFPEKLIPKTIVRALRNERVPVYGSGKNVRDWMFVEDNCSGILAVHENGKAGEVYNIGAGQDRTNIEIVKTVLKVFGKPEDLIEFVADRPGHDFRYALDIAKAKKLGWKSAVRFEEGIRKTVDWYLQNRWWWEPLLR
jgi:dTDP-glucose 4,6-dehydratase